MFGASPGTGDTLSDTDAPDGDALRACSHDVGILDGIKGWLCLLYSDSSRNPWDNSIEMGLDCNGLDHWRGIAWDPGRVGGQCLHVCYDCLRVIALFHEVMLLVHEWASLPAWTVTGIGYCQTNTWEVECLGTIYPACDVDRFFGSDEWQIKGRESAVTTGGDDVI